MIIKNYNSYKIIYIISFIFVAIFLINLSFYYVKYNEIKQEEIYETKVKVLNIYEKKDYEVFKLQGDTFIFFSSLSLENRVEKFDTLSLAFVTTKLTFFDFLKGFYTNTIFYEKVEQKPNIWKTLRNYSDSQHYNEMIQELYQALFFANPIGERLRQICATFGISHLVALSGFHLAVLSFIIYYIFYFPYSFLHKRYFPYRNRKFDILLITISFLFIYLLFTGLVASLTRAFVLMCLGLYFLRSDIKILSFNTLFLVFLIVVAFFPRYVFSLSLWFSVFGVFYIYLFILYFKDMKNRIVQILLFNFWIYLAMNPIVHYFFDIASYAQLLSPFITIFFSFFYPFELFVHIIGYGGILDEVLLWFLNQDLEVFKINTPLWFFIIYIIVSGMAIFNKKAFILLNILLFGFTTYIYI